jgi:ElaB/YqjD/DUF883 family membrane-anchored ribosome-binding protein
MQTTTVENNKNAESTFAHLAAKAAEGKMLCEEFTELGKRKAQRLIRQGREAGEDCLDETTHYVKHHPWQSLGIAVGLGAFAGCILGWTCSQARK